ncbi:MAG: hypothetical protein P0Y53_21255 [Candidatus Pseudobacter hemicellulosilyticus]|uniref:Uncharacterized protein n=1 Tax=Candidatus Pseudobacter hemicellulosilyticus TaxID=3121375 RepID=A0AAJ5WS02_9BACT|nr:MAG: hypothetical protein P0Y53_21255 [Pseudobacter sp.]
MNNDMATKIAFLKKMAVGNGLVVLNGQADGGEGSAGMGKDAKKQLNQ